MSDTTEWITLARIVRPQGRRGELLADLFTGFPQQFAAGVLSLLDRNGERAGTTVEAHWFPTGRNAGRIVLKLATVETISQAELLAGCELQMPADRRIALEQGTYYVSDLIGCTLMDGERFLGTVDDVQFPLYADGRKLAEAAPLFVIRGTDHDEVLIPFVNEFVRRIDTAAKVIEMVLPHGLAELNG